jgi:4-aminobutyrate aminotransferase
MERIPQIRTPLPGPRGEELVARDAAVMSRSVTRPYSLVIERGQGCWVTDADDNSFLDMTAGVASCSTGHAHPRVVSAITEQAGRFLHMSGTDFYYRSQIELAERLARRLLPGAGARVFFANSGSEAIEGAMKLARHATGRPHFLAFLGAFHGRTLGALSLTASKAIQRDRFAPLLPGVFHAPYPSATHSPDSDETFDHIDQLFRTVLPPDSVAAVFVEPILGEGGYVLPPSDFLPRLRALTRRHGMLLVTDEVQTGMGRTGLMLAAEHTGVQADVVCLAKGIASGLPLGAIVAGGGLMDWPPGSHSSTFGGNPLACAAAQVTIDLLDGGLIDNARDVGHHLLAGLRTIQARHSSAVTDARGLGLMACIELDSPELARDVVERCFGHGLLLLTAGFRCVRLSPPLVISDAEVDVGLGILSTALEESILAARRSAVLSGD